MEICAQKLIQKYLLSMFPWNFTLKKQQLAQLTEEPLNKWRFEYQLPSDLLVLHAVYDSGQQGAISMTGYEIQQEKLQTDQNEIFIDYQFQIDEEDFPPYFQEFVVKALAAKMATAITDDRSIRQEREILAFGLPSDNKNGGEYGIAKRIDSLKNPTSAIPADDLFAARLSNSSIIRIRR